MSDQLQPSDVPDAPQSEVDFGPVCPPLTQLEPPGLRLVRSDWLWMLVVTLLAFGLRAWHLDYPEGIYFDEKYYARAAGDYLSSRQDSNDVHPPLAKLQIAAGLLVFDALKVYGWHHLGDSVGWRISALLVGCAMLPLTYLLALVLSGQRRYVARVALCLIAFDFLHLVECRIAMLDIFQAFWMLLGMFWAARYCCERPRLDWALHSALAFGVATACKWNAVSGAAACCLVMMSLPGANRRRRIALSLLFAGALALVYLLAYVPFLIKAGTPPAQSLATIAAAHRKMIKFRYNEKQFTHQYLCQFYTWPLVLRPIWFYWKEADGVVRGIVALGNPVFWWSFLFFFLELSYATWRAAKRGDPRRFPALFLIANYLFDWGFWSVSTTGGFFYYMLPMVPIMAIVTALALDDWGDTPTGRHLRTLFLVTLGISTLIYLPLLTAWPVPRPYFNRLFFIRDWT